MLLPCSCFLWFLSHGLFIIFVSSVLNLICSVSILLHVKVILVPFISATDLFPPSENSLFILKNGRRYSAGSAFLHRVSLNCFSLLLSWHREIHCMCLCGPWTIHVVILFCIKVLLIQWWLQGNLNIFMEGFKTLIFSVHLNELDACYQQQCLQFGLPYPQKTPVKFL